MKKFLSGLIVILAAVTLCACNGPRLVDFLGTWTKEDDEFDISFKVLNTTYSHEFKMKQGESIRVKIEKEEGDISVKIQKGEDAPVYEGNGEAVSEFTVNISEDGTYTLSVTGADAKGHVTFTRE